MSLIETSAITDSFVKFNSLTPPVLMYSPIGAGSVAKRSGFEPPLLTASLEEQEAVYTALRQQVDSQIDQTVNDPDRFAAFQERIQHGEQPQEMVDRAKRLAQHFIIKLPGFLTQILQERYEDTALRSTVYNISHFEVGRLINLAMYYYLVERDLYGPLIVNFAQDMADLYKTGILPRTVIGMRRDFEPFGRAMRKLGVPERAVFLRRAIFHNVDPFNHDDRAALTEEHVQNLATLLKQEGVIMDPEVVFLDSGAWGTLVAEFSFMRTFLSQILTGNLAERLLELPSDQRLDTALEAMPNTILRAIDTIVDPASNINGPPEPVRRRQLMLAILADDDVLHNIAYKLQGPMRTTAIDFYSHQGRDERFPRHEKSVLSWFDVVAAKVVPWWFGEITNDSIEENLASKVWTGPIELMVQRDGQVSVVLRRNESLARELSAHAARKGVQHAVEIYSMRKVTGVLTTSEVTARHLFYLYQLAQETGEWTGVMPINTPTWPYGDQFLAPDGPWARMVEIPESTYFTIDQAHFAD